MIRRLWLRWRWWLRMRRRPILRVEEISRAKYDALPVKDPQTLYRIWEGDDPCVGCG